MRQRLLRHLLIFLFFLLIAIVMTYPVVLSLSTQFLGGDTGDSYEMARHIWWFKTALQTGQSPFWQSNLGYPGGFSGVSLQADFLQFFPMWLFAFVMPLASAFNITVLLTLALNGWSMYALVNYLLSKNETSQDSAFTQPSRSAWQNNRYLFPALIAGVVFMAAPTLQGHLFEGHTGLLVQWTVPLYIYALYRLVEPPTLSWRWFFASVVLFQLVPSGHMLQVIYMLMPVTGMFLLWRMWQRDWTGSWRIIGMGLVSSVILVIFLIPLIQETLASEAYTDAGGFVRYSADLLGIVSPSFYHPLFGKLPYTAQVLGVNLGEGSMYLGIIATMLALFGVMRFRAARGWLLLAVIVWGLSLGPLLKIFDKPVVLSVGGYLTYVTLPFALVQNLPGINLARSPARFNFALALALAIMAGYGAAWLWDKLFGETNTRRISPVHFIAFAVISAGIVYEYQSFFPMPTRPAAIPDAVYALKDRGDVRAIFDIPYEHLLAAKDALYFQTAHEKPLIAGHVTRQTPVNPAKLAIMQYTLDPTLLKTRGADIVIFHKKRAQQSHQYDALQFLLSARFPPPFYQDDDIAIYETPQTTDTPDFLTHLPSDTNLTGIADYYFYTPESDWVNFSAQLTGDGQTVSLALNNVVLHRWIVRGRQNISVPLPAGIDEFDTVRLSLEPACPLYTPDTLTCRSVAIEGATLNTLREGVIYDLIQYGRGVELAASSVPAAVNGKLAVNLWWRFNQARSDTDVRFVHILDSQGQRVAQEDSPPGAMAAGSEWTETVTLDISTLPPGQYSVRTGWYDFNTMQRFDVETPNLIGGQDGAPEIEKFTIQ